MKRKILLFGLLILVGAVVSSCLYGGNDEEEEPSLEKEMAILDEFIREAEKDGFNVDTTELGVYYFVVDEGLGAYPQMGDSLTVIYDGYLMNGYLFYSSAWNFENGKWGFVLGEEETIEGWDDGMQVIKKGSTVQLMIPSSLAYGANWKGTEIPPYSTLVYVVEMVDIIDK